MYVQTYVLCTKPCYYSCKNMVQWYDHDDKMDGIKNQWIWNKTTTKHTHTLTVTKTKKKNYGEFQCDILI